MACFVEDMIQIAEAEDKLFESLLKVEFRKAEILKEDSTALVPTQKNDDDAIDAEVKDAPADDSNNANDEVKKKFIERVLETIKKFFGAIKTLGEKIMNKMKDFFYSDNKLIDKSLNALQDNNNLQGFDGIDNFQEPNLDWRFDDNSIGLFLKPMKQMLDHNFFIIITKDPEINKRDADKIIVSLNSALKKPVDNWNKDGSTNFQWDTAVSVLKDGKLTKPIFSIVRQMNGFLGTLNGLTAKSTYANSWSNSSDTNKAISAYIDDAKDVAKNVFGTHVKYFKSIRQALIVCGTYALKKVSSKSSDTQAIAASANMMAYMSGHESEVYLDEQFEFV